MDKMEESSEQPVPQTPLASAPEGLQVTPPLQKTSKINKKVLFLSLLLLVLGLSLGYLLFGRKNSEKTQKLIPVTKPVTTESKPNIASYTHPTYGYKLSYTKSGEIDFLKCDGTPVNNNKFIIYEKSGLYPTICTSQGEGHLITIDSRQAYDCNATENWSTEESSVVVDGIESKRCISRFIGGSFLGLDGPIYRELVVACKPTEISPNCFGFVLNGEKYLNTFNEILASFKFADERPEESATSAQGKSSTQKKTQPSGQEKGCTGISYGLCITPTAGWSIEEKNIDGNQLVGILKSFDSSFYISKEEGMGYSSSGNIYANEPHSQTLEDTFSVKIMGESYSSSIVHPVNEDTGYGRYIISLYADKLPEPVYIYSKVESLEDLEAVKKMISSITVK